MVWTPLIVRERVFAYLYVVTLAATLYGGYVAPASGQRLTVLAVTSFVIWLLLGWTAAVMDLQDLWEVLKVCLGSVGGVFVYIFLAASATVPTGKGEAIIQSLSAHAAAVTMGVVLALILLVPGYALRRHYDLDALGDSETPEEKVMGHNLNLRDDE